MVLKKNNWVEPTITENFEPERIILSLKLLSKSDDKKATIKSLKQKDEIVGYLTIQKEVTSREISNLLNLAPTRAKELLRELVKYGLIVAEGSNKNRIYKLKK